MPTIDDYRWLLSEAAKPALQIGVEAKEELAALTRLRKELSAERASLVAELAILRRLARDKFVHAEHMFFTRRGLEQATDDVIARYKASRFPVDSRIVDICCGLGGDLIALGSVARTAVGYDRDPVMAMLASANCRVTTEANAAPCRAWALAGEADPALLADAAAWHIDPDRRPVIRRATQMENMQPGPEIIERMLATNGNAAIKLAPATEPPEVWRSKSEWEWISRRGECKQLVCWFGTTAKSVGNRRATVLENSGELSSIVGRRDEELSSAERVASGEIGRYVYDPDAAVLAAGLVHTLAAQRGLALLHPECVYLTSDNAVADPCLAAFEVLDAMPFDVRKVRQWLAERNVGRLEIKKRGVNIVPDQLRRELKPRGEESACLILARRGDRVTALLTRRVSPAH